MTSSPTAADAATPPDRVARWLIAILAIVTIPLIAGFVSARSRAVSGPAPAVEAAEAAPALTARVSAPIPIRR